LSPVGLAFDGANIWVTNSTSDTVTKLLASTGAALGTYPVGGNPLGIAFDGINIWVTNTSQASLGITELMASTGATVSTFTVGSFPSSVLFDGANIVGNESRQQHGHEDYSVTSPFNIARRHCSH
jgi:YVTN family beta-propeller protein